VNHARRAVEVLEGLEGLEDEARIFSSAATSVLGQALLQKGDADEAVVSLTQRVQSCQASLAETPDDHDSMRTLGDALQELWKALFAAGRWQDSIQPLMDTIAIYRTMSSGARDQRRSMAVVFFMLAYAHNQLLEHSEAAIAAEQSANVWQALVDGDPSDNELQVSLAHALGLLGESLSALDRRNEAVQAITRAVGHLQLPAELNPDDHMQHLTHLLDRLGTYLRDLELSVEAEETQARLDDLRRRFPKSAEDT
jgi:tetratricopeptide (TPR) repeat protein